MKRAYDILHADDEEKESKKKEPLTVKDVLLDIFKEAGLEATHDETVNGITVDILLKHNGKRVAVLLVPRGFKLDETLRGYGKLKLNVDGILAVCVHKKANPEEKELASSLNLVLWDRDDYIRLKKAKTNTKSFRDLLLIETGLAGRDPVLERLSRTVPHMLTYRPFDILESLLGVWFIFGGLAILLSFLAGKLNYATFNLWLLGLAVLTFFTRRADKKRKERVEYVILAVIRKLTPVRGGLSTPELAFITKLKVEELEITIRNLLRKDQISHSSGKWCVT